MGGRAKIVLAALVLGLLALAGCGDTYRWNQRLTVTVDTPQGEVSGSSVSAVKWTEGGNLIMGFNYYYAAEAVVVPLPNGRYLFALNTHIDRIRQSDGTFYYLPNAVWVGAVAPASVAKVNGNELRVDLFKEVASKSGRAAGLITVPPYQYPALITFKDLSDPRSGKEVDPADLAATFGSGYKLKSITLEITVDSITQGQIRKILPWVETLMVRLDGSDKFDPLAPNPFLNSLSAYSFARDRLR